MYKDKSVIQNENWSPILSDLGLNLIDFIIFICSGRMKLDNSEIRDLIH